MHTGPRGLLEEDEKDNEGAALAHSRILNADVSNFAILLVNDQIIKIFNAHGLHHYQTVGGCKTLIKSGHVIVIEGFDIVELKVLFGNGKATIDDWSAHLSLFRLEDLDTLGLQRIFRAIEEKDIKLSAMWGWEFLPSGVQLYAESWTNHVLEEEIVINALAKARDDNESPRVIAALGLIKDYLKDELPHAPAPARDARELDPDKLEAALQVNAVKADAFPIGWYLPTPESVQAAMKHAETYGCVRTDGDEAPTAAALAVLSKASRPSTGGGGGGGSSSSGGGGGRIGRKSSGGTSSGGASSGGTSSGSASGFGSGGGASGSQRQSVLATVQEQGEAAPAAKKRAGDALQGGGKKSRLIVLDSDEDTQDGVLVTRVPKAVTSSSSAASEPAVARQKFGA
ncbi:hypothetical protein JCM8208_004868 [Rhodotorula glutinis]